MSVIAIESDPRMLADELRELKELVADLAASIAELRAHCESLEERFTRHQEKTT